MNRNYLLGKGENLTTVIEHMRGGGEKVSPYTFQEAKAALAPKIDETSQLIDALPGAACPSDQAVAVLTLHPAYLAKSYFPSELIAAVGLRAVGSRDAVVVPRKPLKLQASELAGTTEVFVAGPRSNFRDFSNKLAQWREESNEAKDVIKIEDVRYPRPEERVKPLRSEDRIPLMEVALYGAGLKGDPVLISFRDYLASLGIAVDLSRHLNAGSLYFVPVRVPREQILDVARFSFLRVTREMPALRALVPKIRLSTATHRPFDCELPFEPPLDPNVKVAIFDGGLPDSPDLTPWARRLDAHGVGEPDSDFQAHGLAVTSAALFGPLSNGRSLDRPYAGVDHYRVLDSQSSKDPQAELYPVLMRIVRVLRSNSYDYVNMSLGPDLPVEDDEVNPWTMLLDPLFARGRTLATVAAGNSGTADARAGLNRIQPPADGVNLLAVGSCDTQSRPWGRATYSSVGPGRSTGRVKPDVLGFGGTAQEPFWALRVCPISGTKRRLAS